MLLKLLLIAYLVKSGFAIKCYICDSSEKPNCVNLTDTTDIIPETCSVQNLNPFYNNMKTYNSGRNWLINITEMNYYGTTPPEPPMACQKIVGTDGYGKQTVIRRCQLHTNVCEDYKAKLLKWPNYRIDFCETCNNTDACNDAQLVGNHKWLQSMLIIAAVVIVCNFY